MIRYLTKIQGAKGEYDACFDSPRRLAIGDIVDMLNGVTGEHQDYRVEYVIHVGGHNRCVIIPLPAKVNGYLEAPKN